jgi:predicted Zn-ribbon and HTH transcriptional regulator
MKHISRVTCIKCSFQFEITDAADSCSHLLHCVRCGREKTISFREIIDHYNRYLKSIRAPALIQISRNTDAMLDQVRTLSQDEKKYTFMVEHLAGVCVCGAMFKLSARPRCPKCRSMTLNKGHSGIPVPVH